MSDITLYEAMLAIDEILTEAENCYVTEMKSKGEYRLKKFMDKYHYSSDTNFDSNSPNIIKKDETGTILLNNKRVPVRFYDSKPTDEKPVKTATASTTKSGTKYFKIDKKFIKNMKGKDLDVILNHEQGHHLINKKNNPDRNNPEYDMFDKKVEPLTNKIKNAHTSIHEFEADKYAMDNSNIKDSLKALRHTRKYVNKKYGLNNSKLDNDYLLRKKAMEINKDMKK